MDNLRITREPVRTKGYGPRRFLRKFILNFATRTAFLPGRLRARLSGLGGVDFASSKTCFIGRFVCFDDIHPELISIGRNAMITSGTKILTHFYEEAETVRQGYEHKFSHGRVRIGHNVFIGLNVLIVKDVSIGDNAIVAAGSVVISDVPADSIFAGNPARKIGTRWSA
jgi:acetyltransferase-like isoleucine patch superfamily enzyme